jgi:hypothetical protein
LKEYDAPAQKRIMQLQEVGQAAVWIPFYMPCLTLTV